jgi:predicted anti-sigma-YlaC factor YlaD
MHAFDYTCAPVREQISLGLDGELSEFEQAALLAHLDGCPSCRAFAAGAAEATAHLRTAPLEPLERRLATPARPLRRVVRTAMRTSTLGAAAAAAVVGALMLHTPQAPHVMAVDQGSGTRQDLIDFHARRRAQLHLPGSMMATIRIRVPVV